MIGSFTTLETLSGSKDTKLKTGVPVRALFAR